MRRLAEVAAHSPRVVPANVDAVELVGSGQRRRRPRRSETRVFGCSICTAKVFAYAPLPRSLYSRNLRRRSSIAVEADGAEFEVVR